MRTAARIWIAILFIAGATLAPAAAIPADTTDADYRVYTGEGEPATLDDIQDAFVTTDVVFVGETHSDPTAHALHDSLLQRAYDHHLLADTTLARPVGLSLEMFERDAQPVVDEYLDGLITEDHFLASSRPWDQYESAYRPLVEFARTHDLAVLAANAPRRYVNRVSREGPEALEDLPPTAQQWLPPLPYPGPSEAYRAKWEERMRGAMGDDHGADAGDEEAHPHASMMEHMLDAQALWDATMAYTIAEHLMQVPDAFVVHITGSFHVSEGTGTPEALAHYRPSARTTSVVIQPTDDIAHFDPEQHEDLGDFVILTDSDQLPDLGPMQSF